MPISDCEVRDPRMRRTRQLLQGALRTLLQAKGFDEISVQDITDTATVNRVTFYDHYTDKFALLDAMVASGFHSLLEKRKVRYDGTCPSAASAIILAVCEYFEETHSNGAACQRQSAFEPLIEAAITSAIRRVLMEGMPDGGSTSGLPPGMVATAASWAIYGAAKGWFQTPGHPPADEIMPLVLRVVLPILQAANPADSRDSASVAQR